MDFTLRDILVAGGLVGLGFFSHKVLRSVSCWTQKKRIPDDHCVKAHDKLEALNIDFKKELINVVDGVWVAIGYALANSIMIEGDNGVIIVDTTESYRAAKAIMEDFRKVCTKPIVAVIYTHNHTDHVGGTRAFTEYSHEGKCDIYAHEQTASIISGFISQTGTIGFMRAARQFGQFLPSQQHINCGIGPCLDFTQDTGPDILLPTKTFPKDLRVTISGVDIHMIHAPGETDDQIVVFLPKLKVLCPADNIYKAFPNLYAIRGTPARDAAQWAKSLAMMRDLNADYLVPSHTQPLHGCAIIRDTFNVYIDAITFVHDQTIRRMNHGWFLDDIVSAISLPDHLKEHPYLQEYYGTVAWSVRGIYTSYIGWFGGDPSLMHPFPPPVRAARMVKLAGGVEKLLDTSEESLLEGDYQWALECSQAIMRVSGLLVGDKDVKDVKTEKAREVAIKALEGLASGQISANGRNYYLTYARELEGSLCLLPSAEQRAAAVLQIGGVETIKLLACRLIVEKALDMTQRVVYRFSDTQTAVEITIDRGIARANEVPFVDNDEAAKCTAAGRPYTVNLDVTVDESKFLEIASNLRNKTVAIVQGDMVVTGAGISSSIALKKFMACFDDPAVPIEVPP